MLTSLSPREHEIASLIAQGYLRKQVAKQLGIAEGTVDSHVKRISEKVSGAGKPTHRITRLFLIPASTGPMS